MSYSVQTSRKGSSVGGNLTSRSSSGFGDDSYSFRPETAPGNPREKGLPISPLAISERSKSVPVNMRLPGNRSPSSSVRPSSRELLQSEDVGSQKYKNARAKTVEIGAVATAKEELNQPWYISMLREKEERLLRMGDEINRLAPHEEDSKRKDAVIADLQKQIAIQEALKAPQEAQSNAAIADMKQRLQLLGDEVLRLTPFEDECKRNNEVVVAFQNELEAVRASIKYEEKVVYGSRGSFAQSENSSTLQGGSKTPETLTEGTDARAYNQKVRTLRESMQSASEDIEALKDRFDTLAPEKLTPEEEVNIMREELEIKNQIIFELEDKLSAAHKELSINEGFVTALQKDVQLRENKIMKLTTQVEKAEDREKQAMADVRAMSKKFSDMRETQKHSDMLLAAELELTQAKEQLRQTEEVITKLQEKIQKQNKELRDVHRKVKKGNEADKKARSEIKILTQDLEDMKRREQISRVTCEHVSARFDRLRSRIIQSVFITPGAVHPNNLISDIVVFNAMKKVVDERTEFHTLLQEKDPNFPPLQVELDMTPDDEKLEESAPVAPANERKSGKGGRKSPKHR